MKVDPVMFNEAVRFYRKAFNASFYNNRHFCKYFGITTKQWIKMCQTGKLKVSPESVMKLKHASLLMRPHGKTLLKVFEARNKK